VSHPEIVVGVDGSPASAEALVWAAEYAKLVDGTLRVVHAWSPAVGFIVSPPMPMDWGPLRRQAHSFPRKFVRQVLGDEAGVDVVPVTRRGTAAQVLVNASKQMDLLVIGSLGLGGLKGMVLGSVGHHCTAHSQCPVVIVHHPPPRKPKRRRLPRTGRREAAATRA
jgi:nucleotide-binding universal stress UspA family protein